MVDNLLNEIKKEYEFANKKFPLFNSYHEGYAVLKEEVEEMWEEIKHDKVDNKQARKERIKKEIIQVAAMALKLLIFNESDK